ncbi:MAG: 3'-5' exonuclease [Bacteroidetes bacterium]|nr:MAG: 3'-5' exonuclease [Bacteroidota bacterium]
MLKQLNLNKVLFLDIETVPNTPTYTELDESVKKLWDDKMRWQSERDNKTPEEIYEKAGIFAEFGKVICISVGFLTNAGTPDVKYRTTSFAGDDESKLLQDFSNLMNSHYYRNDQYLCAHNGKEFDYPFIARRMLLNSLTLPDLLDLAGKKPWEIHHLDTMELWKFGDYKHYTSLNLLTNIFNIPTPKDDITGADVAKVYYEDKDLDRIVTYCEKDTLAVAQVMLKYKGMKLIEDDQVIRV